MVMWLCRPKREWNIWQDSAARVSDPRFTPFEDLLKSKRSHKIVPNTLVLISTFLLFFKKALTLHTIHIQNSTSLYANYTNVLSEEAMMLIDGVSKYFTDILEGSRISGTSVLCTCASFVILWRNKCDITYSVYPKPC